MTKQLTASEMGKIGGSRKSAAKTKIAHRKVERMTRSFRVNLYTKERKQ
jgi:hypothetical protein